MTTRSDQYCGGTKIIASLRSIEQMNRWPAESLYAFALRWTIEVRIDCFTGTAIEVGNLKRKASWVEKEVIRALETRLLHLSSRRIDVSLSILVNSEAIRDEVGVLDCILVHVAADKHLRSISSGKSSQRPASTDAEMLNQCGCQTIVIKRLFYDGNSGFVRYACDDLVE